MNIEKSLDIIKGKLLMIDKMLKQDQEEGHGSSYEMQKEDFEAIETLLTAYEKEKEKNKEYTMKINNLISQIESAIDFMKTDKLKMKVDMYQQKEEAEIEFNKYALVVLKKMLQELLEGRK